MNRTDEINFLFSKLKNTIISHPYITAEDLFLHEEYIGSSDMKVDWDAALLQSLKTIDAISNRSKWMSYRYYNKLAERKMEEVLNEM